MLDWRSFNYVQTPASLQRPALLLGVLMVFLCVGLPLTPWQQAVQGDGKVVAYSPVDREQVIEAPVKGRIVRWFVVEGQVVAKGDPIVELADIDPDYVARLDSRREAALTQKNAAASQVESYRAQETAMTEVRKREAEAALLKIAMGEQKVNAAKEQLRAAEASLRAATLNLQRQDQLLKEGLTSRRDVELATMAAATAAANADKQRASQNEAEALVLSLQAERIRKISETDAKIASIRAELQKAAANEAKGADALTKLEVELARQQSRLVRAPRVGTILHMVGSESGKVLKVGDQLAMLVPQTSSRAVELWVDGNDAPLITPGRHVRLQFEGWPAVQFTGWPSVAVGTFGGTVSVVDALSRREGKFRVLITPDALAMTADGDTASGAWPGPGLLRQGVQVRGWVLLEQVSLGYELWRQLNGFPMSLRQAPTKES